MHAEDIKDGNYNGFWIRNEKADSALTAGEDDKLSLSFRHKPHGQIWNYNVEKRIIYQTYSYSDKEKLILSLSR